MVNILQKLEQPQVVLKEKNVEYRKSTFVSVVDVEGVGRGYILKMWWRLTKQSLFATSLWWSKLN